MRCLSCLIFLFLALAAQSQSWQWARSAGGINHDYSQSVVTDSYGNVYVAGYFTGPSIAFETAVLLNRDSSGITADMFLVKYDGDGNVIWAKSYGGVADDELTSLAIDSNDNIYGCAKVKSYPTVNFDTIVLSNNGRFCIAKWNSNGDVLWVRGASGAYGQCSELSLAIDGLNNISIVGLLSGNYLVFGNDTLHSHGYFDFFLVRFDSHGNYLWGHSGGGDDIEWFNTVTCDREGNTYIMGATLSLFVHFGNITINTANGHNQHLFFAKYDSLGNTVWAKSIGDTANQAPGNLLTDRDGNIYVTGSLGDSLVYFGSYLVHSGLFLAKYQPDGNVVWAKNVSQGSSFNLYGYDVDESGSIFMGGYFQGMIKIGPSTLVQTNGYNAYFTKIDSSGNAFWATAPTTSGNAYARDISVDRSGNVYIVGDFDNSSVAFGTTTLNGTPRGDIFISKFATAPTDLSTVNSTSAHIIYPNPNTGRFNITLPQNEGEYQLRIYDLLGQLVYQLHSENTHIEVNLPYQAKGTYLLQLRKKDGSFAYRKIIIE